MKLAQQDAFDRFIELDTILRRVLDEPRERWAAFVSHACAGDRALEDAALRLLEASQDQAAMLDEGALTERMALAVALDSRLRPGTHLGQYEIEAFLDAGGTGEVYRARDRTLGRDVALKVLPAELGDDPRRLIRFEREAHLLAALNHPNIATIHALERSGELHFLVLELVPGRSLAERLREGPLPVTQLLELARQVAEAIGAAHAAGIAHGDVKPANIALTPDGRPKLLDLGLAELRQTGERSAGETDPASVVGSARYLSPERWAGGPVDFKADLWAFGCTVYEGLVGAPAFPGETSQEVRDAVLACNPDFRACPPDAPDALRELLRRCLAKNPEDRFPDIFTARRAIEACIETRRTSLRAVFARRPAIPALLLLALAIGIGSVWIWRVRVSERVWALGEALPEIQRRLDADDYLGVHELVARATSILGENAQLERALVESSGALEVLTDPPGAVVAFQPYDDFGGEWRPLGTTPIKVSRFPRGTFRFRIDKPGYAKIEVPYTVALKSYIDALTESDLRDATDPSTRLAFHLEPDDAQQEGMLAVEGGHYDPIPLVGFRYGGGAVIPPFHIDRAEVSNREFQDFVNADGYRRPELWPPPEGDSAASVDAEVAGLRDRSGHAAPAGWSGGRFLDGTGDLPVSGVSWFEASAYCAFRGKRLPTLFHWARAAYPSWDAGAPLSPAMARHANFSQKGPSVAGKYPALSVVGAVDMAGNVAEWTATEGVGGHYALGGSWADSSYALIEPVVVGSFERRETVGFRCARYEEGEATAALERPLTFARLPLDDVPPMSDAEFEQTRRLQAYPRTPVDAVVESTRTLSSGAIEEWVSIAPASGNERIPILIRLPTGGVAPYQVVVVLPGDMLWSQQVDGQLFDAWLQFLVSDGRAVVEPVLAGTFQRQGNAPARAALRSPAAFDRLLEAWVHDLGRTLDYVEERSDLDSKRVAYLGASFGAWVSPHLLAYEPRIAAAVLWAGGFSPVESPARVPLRANLMRRVTIPVLLMNGRYDYQSPLIYQRAMIRFFGAPESEKRQRVFETSHWPYPRRELIDETRSWLDRFLGPVEPPRG